MPVVDNLFRVIKPFPWKPSQFKSEIMIAAGKVVTVESTKEANRLMGLGYIEPLRIPFNNNQGRIHEMPARQFRGKRIGIWLVTSNYYSGGRIHLWQYAWCLADAGAEVFLITNGQPKWANDYPHQKRIRVLQDGRQEPPEDLDILMTDSKGDLGLMHYRRTHPRAALVTLNFETPNWVEMLVPDYAQKLNMTQRSKVAFQDADLIMANSGESLKYLKKWVGGDARYEYDAVLPPAVNEFALARSGKMEWPRKLEKPRNPYAVFSARPAAYKGFDLAISAIWALDIPFDIVLFGKPPTNVQGSDKHHAYIYAGQPDNVKFLAMRGARVALAPSLFEGFGMVPAEALASGTPVIAFDLPVLRQEYKGLRKHLTLVPYGDKTAFRKAVAKVATTPKPAVNSAPVLKRLGMRAMQRRIEALPYHAVKTNRVSAQLLGYWGVLPEAIESVYDFADEILIAFGRCPEAPKVDDGSLERIRAFPDPNKKIRIEIRDNWHDKKVMRQWCSDQNTGNFALVLDGDEVWVHPEKLLERGMMFGSPRWCNLWHSAKHWIYDVENKGTSGPGSRWGYRVRNGEPGSYCPHYRWSWWRRSFEWKHHSIPGAHDQEELYTRNSLQPPSKPTSESETVAQQVPECMIYHFGHALPRKVMAAKHSFYLKRDGSDPGRRMREAAWHEWDGEEGDCGDGVVESVDWDLPDIVKRAAASAARMKVE